MIQACRDRIRDAADLDNASHAGLILSSYLPCLREDEAQSRNLLLSSAQKAPARSDKLYVEAFQSWKEYRGKDHVSEIIEVNGRAIVGLGAESPLETGLTLHHTYGTPLLPGSALKGIASHYCDQVWGSLDTGFERCGTHFSVLFGTTEDGGHIMFDDAWVLPESLSNCLDIDVMTVHHPGYYQGKGPEPPGDSDDPNPITFLSVKGQFQVFLSADVPGEAGRAWASLAMRLLLEALENWGIGAKTNAGYGRMRRVAKAQARKTPGAATAESVTLASGQFPCKPGSRIQAKLLEERTKRGGWKAIYDTSGRQWIGPIQNTTKVPPSARVGDVVMLIVRFITQHDIGFEWPDAR